MSGPKNDSHLPEIERDKKIHESCPPRYNKNFISDLKKKQKEMKLQPHSNHRPTLDLQDKPLEHDPKEVAESSKFKLNIQETAAPEPGLRGIMCSFKINPGPHPHTTPSEKPDLRETARWQGVLTFRDAENPHHDLEDPSLDQSSRAARALPAPSPEFVDGGSGFVEIHMTWTEQILKSLRVFDEGLGLQQNRSYIPCIDIAYWGVFCFRMYGTPFLTSEESKGLSSERFRYKDEPEQHNHSLLHVLLNQQRIKQERWDMEHPQERLKTRREVHEECSRCGSLLTSFSVDGPGPSNTPQEWDGQQHLSEGHLKTFHSYHGSESSSSDTSEQAPVKVVTYSSPWTYGWLASVEPLSNPRSPFGTPSDIPSSARSSSSEH